MVHSAFARIDRLEQELGELIEEHGRASLDVGQYRGRSGKLRFYREVLGFEPWEAQVEIAHAVHDHKRVVVAGGHAVGKERSAAAEALYAAIVLGQLVLVLSATERQVIGQTMKELSRLFRGNQQLPGQLFHASLRIDGEDRIVAFSGASVDALTGWHDPNGVLVIISEGQGENLEDIAYDAALANATDDLSRVLILGNPVRPFGRFFEASRSSNWHFIRIPVPDHPNIREGRMVIPGGPSPSWPAEMIVEYGEESPFVQARVYARFPEEAAEALMRLSWIEAAIQLGKTGELEEAAKGELVIIAVDPARHGPDETMLSVRQGFVLRELIGWRGLNTMESEERVRIEAARIRAELKVSVHVVVDEIGIGAGIFDRLAERTDVTASAFNSARSAADPERFANLRAEAYWKLRQLLEEGLISLPDDDQLREELAQTKWMVTSSGQVRIEKKDELKSRLGRSPDRADSVSMAFWVDVVEPFEEMIYDFEEAGGFVL